MDEVFGEENFVVALKFSKTAGLVGNILMKLSIISCGLHGQRSYSSFAVPILSEVKGEIGATQYNYAMSDTGDFKRVHDLTGIGKDCLFSHDNLTSQTGNDILFWLLV